MSRNSSTCFRVSLSDVAWMMLLPPVAGLLASALYRFFFPSEGSFNFSLLVTLLILPTIIVWTGRRVFVSSAGISRDETPIAWSEITTVERNGILFGYWTINFRSARALQLPRSIVRNPRFRAVVLETAPNDNPLSLAFTQDHATLAQR